MTNPLLDSDFLEQLDEFNSHTTYARITSLNMLEAPLERIEGKVTGGSINIDGTSAVRRTCSINMIASDVNINNFYWGLHTKFKLEIGLQNDINKDYPDIIWFPQGIYVISSFNTSYTTSGFTISITGKDKMCLLNGEIGGSLPASIDFGTTSYYDLENLITYYEDLTIKEIIREGVHAYGSEPYSNIIINDLDIHGLELLESRCADPLYLTREIGKDDYNSFTFNGKTACYLDENLTNQTTFDDERIVYASRLDSLLPDEEEPTAVWLTKDIAVNLTKVEYGETVGYRLTDLTYSGDLISSIGESFTSILDKIVNMLGNFEYFYDLDGRFIFQEKKNYINTTWNPIVTVDNDRYVENAEYTSQITYNFEGNKLISSFSNNPDMTNVKNDYSIWGTRTGVSGAEIPIHYRYAIHAKPTSYFSILDNRYYTTDEYDWRELIYQMARDHYQYNEKGVTDKEIPLYLKIKECNSEYPTGVTGYEQFYTDMLGFWRDLYDPDYKNNPVYTQYNYSSLIESKTFTTDQNLYIDYDIIPVEDDSTIDRKEMIKIVYQDNNYEIQSLLDSIIIDTTGNTTYYIVNDENNFSIVNTTTLKQEGVARKDLYIKKEDGSYITLLNSVSLEECFYIDENAGYTLINSLPRQVQPVFLSQNGTYNKYYIKHILGFDGLPKEDSYEQTCNLTYYTKDYDCYESYWKKDIYESPDLLNFWIDFLEPGESELSKYAISAIGDRPKVENNDKITAIYFRDTPLIIFNDSNADVDLSALQEKTGYVFMNVGANASEYNYFTISAQGKSAKDELDELLYKHSYCTESVNISTIPIYHLEPNTKIYIRDEKSQINGEYIVSRMTIPLTYNGTMQITATKAPSRLY